MLTKTPLSIATLAIFVLVASYSFAQSGKPVFACNMGTLTAEQRTELSGAIHRLIAAKPATKELPNGYEMTFTNGGDNFVDTVTWIRYERLCCPFFNFSITLDKNNGPLVVKLMGPQGVKAFIDDDLPGLKAMTHGG